ncbi:MAG: hypothetical protein Q9212_000396 [Teloschistes hypoglaucus]
MGAISPEYAVQFTSHGLQIGLPKRPISNAPKPNTRFLKNIIKETDNHNTALKAKEVADARVRLRGIDRHEARSEKNGRDDFRPERSDSRSRKRRKLSGDGNKVHKGEPAKQSRRDLEDKKLDKSPWNPYDNEDSTASDARHSRHRHPPSTSTSPSSDSNSDSDPLASLVGPMPPPPKPLPRGRGAHTTITSNIDTHFNSTYDPSTDITPTNLHAESDDWDNALEALRDRARWKASGAERLRAAEFSDEAVRKWERGGEGKEEVVVWKGRGEGREWDRGKVVGPDGVQTGAEWGGLKGT